MKEIMKKTATADDRKESKVVKKDQEKSRKMERKFSSKIKTEW